MDTDMPQEDNVNDEYDVPLAPNQIQVQLSVTVPKTDTNEKTTTPDAEDIDIKPLLLPRVLGTAIKIETPASNKQLIPKKESIQDCRIQTQEEIFKSKKIFLCQMCGKIQNTERTKQPLPCCTPSGEM